MVGGVMEVVVDAVVVGCVMAVEVDALVVGGVPSVVVDLLTLVLDELVEEVCTLVADHQIEMNHQTGESSLIECSLV